MKDQFYAHSREGKPPEEWHRLETPGGSDPSLNPAVAPRAGAWIEIRVCPGVAITEGLQRKLQPINLHQFFCFFEFRVSGDEGGVFFLGGLDGEAIRVG